MASLPCAGVVTQTADCKAATTDTGMSTVFEKFVQKEVEYFIDVDESLQGNLSEQAREIFEIIKHKEQITDEADRIDFSNHALAEFIERHSTEGGQPCSAALPSGYFYQ